MKNVDRIVGKANISEDKKYRYYLNRYWDKNKRGFWVTFILLNPSTADSEKNDPTIRRCMTFSKDWGYSGLEVLNLFALRSTNPKALKEVEDPIGPENTKILKEVAESSDILICAWGNHGSLFNRSNEVLDLFRSLDVDYYHLGLTKQDQPMHPLYLPKDRRPIKWI